MLKCFRRLWKATHIVLCTSSLVYHHVFHPSSTTVSHMGAVCLLQGSITARLSSSVFPTFSPKVSSGCQHSLGSRHCSALLSYKRKARTDCQLSTDSPTIGADSPLWLKTGGPFSRCSMWGPRDSRHSCVDSQGALCLLLVRQQLSNEVLHWHSSLLLVDCAGPP